MSKVYKVNIQQELVDRLNNTIELKNSTIKYQQDQYLKLQRKLDNKEPLGLNNLLFSYDAILEVLMRQYHPLKVYLERWFGTYDDYIENDGLFFSEDGIELCKGDYWLVNVKTDYAAVVHDLSDLNRSIYKLTNHEEEC